MVISFVKRLIKNILLPQIIKRGWRPSRATPIDEMYLASQFGYDEEQEIKDAVRLVNQNTMTSFERLASLWQQVRYVDKYNIPGAFVECGVWKGGSVGMMALAHRRSCAKPWRRLHLFDSFQGLPEPKSAVDGVEAIKYSGNKSDGALKPIDACVGALSDNKLLLEGRISYPEELITYHVGWFENTVPQGSAEIGPIALLRLDGDWYESTKVCLEHLYPKVVKGGVIVIDDYGHWEGCRKAVDEYISKLHEPVMLSHIDYTGRYWIRVS